MALRIPLTIKQSTPIKRLAVQVDWPLISIIVVNFNGLSYLDALLTSLQNQEYSVFEVLLIDNGSSDGSLEFVRREHPEVIVLETEKNLGYSGAVNLAVDKCCGEFVAVLNMDIVVEPGWLKPLIEFLIANPHVGAVNPQILLAQEPQIINALGQNIHVTGLGFNRMLHFPALEEDNKPQRVSGLQGAAFVIRRDLFWSIGGMNTTNFMYHEDVDISWLINLADYDIYCVPKSIVYHNYTLNMKPWKYYYLERNRWALLLCVYRWPTIFLLVPLFLFTEMMMLVYCLRHGRSFIVIKLQTVCWIWNKRKHLRRRRAWIQSWRKRGDRRILSVFRFNYDWAQLLNLTRKKSICC
jgi:GT2 family glycosyltransferase